MDWPWAMMVRAVGIEPTLLSEPDFESGASTSSTTPATERGLAELSVGRKRGSIPRCSPTIAERLGNMQPRDAIAPRQIGDGARDAEDAGVAARGEPHRLGGLRE